MSSVSMVYSLVNPSINEDKLVRCNSIYQQVDIIDSLPFAHLQMAGFRAGRRMSKDLFCLNQDQDPFRAAYNCFDDSTGDCNLLFFFR